MKHVVRSHRRKRRVWHALKWVLIVLILAGTAVRLALPGIVRHYVNRQLNRSAKYAGRIGDVDLALWRGGYQIQNVRIFKRSGLIKQPFFSADLIDLSIQWTHVFHGDVVGEVTMQHPRINFVAGPTPEQSQIGENTPWVQIMKGLFPVDINRLQINESEIHFENDYSSPPVDIYLHHLTATVTNLTNIGHAKSPLPAGIVADGRALGGGNIKLTIQLNPMSHLPTYQLTGELTNVSLPALNNFFKAYGNFDVNSGRFALYASVAAQNGDYDGYLKVFFDRLHVFKWNKEEREDALQVFWDAIVGSVTAVLKNQSKDELAARIPFSGSYHNGSVDILSAIGSLLRNAFVRALVPGLGPKITIYNVQEKKQEQKEKRKELPPANVPKGATELRNR